VYCIFRLSKQKWSNRGNQSSESGDDLKELARNWMANWCTAVAVSLLVLFTVHYSGLIEMPSRYQFEDAARHFV